MGKYLKKFETTAAYQAAESSLILPNVSLTVDNNTVHYNTIVPTPQHDYVEIGGIKWATMNVGANSVTDGGLYFQWGDTQGYTAAQVGSGSGQKYFDWTDYKYSEGATASDSGAITKYNESDGLTTLQPTDDAITAAWGGGWRTPTVSEWQTLGEAVNSAWTTDYQGSGVSGLVLTDKADNSKVLFFPAVSEAYYGSVHVVGLNGSYMSSSLDTNNGEAYNYLMEFSNVLVEWDRINTRYVGLSVRGVLDE